MLLLKFFQPKHSKNNIGYSYNKKTSEEDKVIIKKSNSSCLLTSSQWFESSFDRRITTIQHFILIKKNNSSCLLSAVNQRLPVASLQVAPVLFLVICLN
jgi:hypothetical protein